MEGLEGGYVTNFPAVANSSARLNRYIAGGVVRYRVRRYADLPLCCLICIHYHIHAMRATRKEAVGKIAPAMRDLGAVSPSCLRGCPVGSKTPRPTFVLLYHRPRPCEISRAGRPWVALFTDTPIRALLFRGRSVGETLTLHIHVERTAFSVRLIILICVLFLFFLFFSSFFNSRVFLFVL